jgi:hypothetical protein
MIGALRLTRLASTARHFRHLWSLSGERRLGPSVPKATPRGPPVIEMIAGRALAKRQALTTSYNWPEPGK